MQVKDIMVQTVEVVDPGMALATAAERMREAEVGLMPIQDGDEVVGVITDRDMAVRAIARGLDPTRATVGEVMTREVVFCYEDESLEEAAGTIADSGLRRLLVLDRAKRMVGIVTLDDLAAGANDPSLAREILKRASRLHAPPRGYERILVALDGSSAAEHVLPTVEPLAEKFGSKLTLIRAVAPVPVAALAAATEAAATNGSGPGNAAMAEARQEAGQYLATVQKWLEAQGLTAETECPEGSASEVILRRARQLDADLIALTTHGRTGVDRLLLGSVAEEVIRRAPCPVHLVRVQGSR